MNVFHTRRLTRILLIILVLTSGALAQTLGNLAEGERLNGKIKSISFQRTYFVWKGQPIQPENRTIGLDLFDTEGRLIQTSVFGNGEERKTLKWTGKTYEVLVSYFDLAGKPILNFSEKFIPGTDSKEADLCPKFSVKTEVDSKRNTEREIETCSDGSLRRTIASEFATEEQFHLRSFAEDARGRTWEIVVNYGINFSYKGFRYTVNDLSQPKYWKEAAWTDEQTDDKNNWTSAMVSSTDSRFPKEQIRFRYLEKRKIIYY